MKKKWVYPEADHLFLGIPFWYMEKNAAFNMYEDGSIDIENGIKMSI